jgi:hypothetical protein
MFQDVYHQRSNKDGVFFKVFGERNSSSNLTRSEAGHGVVYTAVISQFAETILESMIGYQYLVGGWGNPLVNGFASDFQPLLNAICQYLRHLLRRLQT